MIGGDMDPTEPLFSGDDRILIDRRSFRTRPGPGRKCSTYGGLVIAKGGTRACATRHRGGARETAS